MKRSLAYLWYPVFASAAVVAFGWMLKSGTALAVAAYAPVIAVGVAIVVLEWRFPEYRAWRPRWSDIRADAAFMALVQVALPRFLAAVGVIAVAAWMHAYAPSAWWPHEWPLAAQAVLMLLAIDFMRYWLHRACHHYPALWRLHEVHHSPDILYILNVGRFHPFEKALHFCFDTAPFLVLGVAPELIACYFLLYSVNGLFQHSNVRLRYGWLNYIVGSAETHRWHHARDPRTAACNFGNTTIIWDLVFGTWYLPKQRRVDEIGIMNRAYPKDFLSQMLVPFRREAVRSGMTLRALLANLLVDLRLRSTCLIQGRRIASLVKDPLKAQRAVLARIVSDNDKSAFGRRHGFDTISSIAEYAKRVPISDYEALRPYIDAEIDRSEAALTVEAPERYARTSGTTGRPKDVPLNHTHLCALRRIQETAVAFQYRTCPAAFDGAILAIVSPPFEGEMRNGKPYGSASGMVAANTPALVLQKFVVPPAVLTIADSRVKYLTILRLALARPDVTYLGSANATTLLTLIKLYRQYEPELLDDLRKGTFFCAKQVPESVMRTIGPRLTAQAARAGALARLRAAHGELRICNLWPELRLVVTWTCASAGIAVDALRRELAPRTRVLELGYVSSEFRGTITLGRRAGTGLPTLDTHFFEFAEREAWDRGERELLTLDRVRKGVDYYVIITTPSGLYRYFINDLVRVTGFLHRTPLLKFSQKGKGVTNITGEKLYEAQVLAAVRAVMDEAGCGVRFVMMLADEAGCCYRLYIEAAAGRKPDTTTLATLVDRKLCELNVEYQAKRESGRLGALTAAWLSQETGEAYKQFCVHAGQREGQFKTVAIAYRKDFRFDLDGRVER
jgi:sterol desaturase/sphingolipid hydroxylase (fatty acid hydroxylase superfamily)